MWIVEKAKGLCALCLLGVGERIGPDVGMIELDDSLLISSLFSSLLSFLSFALFVVVFLSIAYLNLEERKREREKR